MEKFKQRMQTPKSLFYRKLRSLLRPANYTLLLMVITSGFMISCDHDDCDPTEPWEAEVDRLRNATDDYKDLEVATSDGYNMEVTGYRTQMGFHYLNVDLLDNQFEIEKPEVLIFAPDETGDLQFVAVEYGIPIADLNNPQPAPEGFSGDSDVWIIDTEFSLWTLHVWTELENPNGIFTPRNPLLP
ncbi:MAG: hypothetical protein ACR2MX_16540 [Cyclobacteriaceae bacterium]